jgi:hypothetical protein
MPQFDVALKKDIAKITQDLITRGLYNSTVQIGDTRAAAETNLDDRAKAIKASIQEVCQAHGVSYESSLPSELGQIFIQFFKSQLIIVNARYNSNIPVENRRLCPIADLNPNVSSHEQEIQLFAESLTGKETTRYDDLIKLLKNNKIVCIVLVICAIIIALGVFTDALTKISAFFHMTETETKIDETVEKVTNGNLTEKDITNSIVADDDRLSQIEKELISSMPDGQILMEIDKNARVKKYGRVLELIGFLNTEQGRDGQRIRFINKLINDKNISLANTFVNKLEMGHNIDKMKSKLAQESMKY